MSSSSGLLVPEETTMGHLNNCSNFASLTLVTCITLKKASDMTDRHAVEKNELESGKKCNPDTFQRRQRVNSLLFRVIAVTLGKDGQYHKLQRYRRSIASSAVLRPLKTYYVIKQA